MEEIKEGGGAPFCYSFLAHPTKEAGHSLLIRLCPAVENVARQERG